ncbi:cRISPR-associated protein Csn2 family [Firmicutes bacterium CAG:345]|nr:cRISPR-associated protein Csn2 family [Firmicutes bacterium CAG:345]
MKKLAINALNICDDISNIDSYLLVIKNKKILYKILSNSDLQYEDSYIQILDENYKELKLSDYVDFISSIINLDSNSKKNLNVLIRRIKKEEIEILRSTSEKINEILEECAKQIKVNSPINISYDIEVDEDDIIKLLSISLQDDSPDLIERINNYINISFELRGIKIFIFYNLLAFLEENELDSLIRTNKYNGIKIIDIENVEFKTSIFDHIKILDEDICVI